MPIHIREDDCRQSKCSGVFEVDVDIDYAGIKSSRWSPLFWLYESIKEKDYYYKYMAKSYDPLIFKRPK